MKKSVTRKQTRHQNKQKFISKKIMIRSLQISVSTDRYLILIFFILIKTQETGKSPLTDVGFIMNETTNSTDCAKDLKHDFLSINFKTHFYKQKMIRKTKYEYGNSIYPRKLLNSLK